jgi:hypothetical protein
LGRHALLLFPLIVIGLAAAGCGGNGGEDEAKPLSLEQRLLSPADAPGFTQQTAQFEWNDAQQVVDEGIGPALPQQNAAEATRVLEDANFIDGAARVLSKPGTKENLITIVLRFGSPGGGTSVLRWLHEQDLAPCTGNCGIRISELAVDGIPEAAGAQRVVNEAAAGATPPPWDRYIIEFTDGAFLYSVERASPYQTPTDGDATDAEDAAQALYDRVKGAPLT